MDNNKRVLLQYGITLDELPEEVQRLTKKISKRYYNRMGDLLTRLSTCTGTDYLSESFLQTIEEIKLCTEDIDSVSSDISNIVGGYIEMQNNPGTDAPTTTQVSPDQATVDSDTTTADVLEENTIELVDKMKSFRQRHPPEINEYQEPPPSTKK